MRRVVKKAGNARDGVGRGAGRGASAASAESFAGVVDESADAGGRGPVRTCAGAEVVGNNGCMMHTDALEALDAVVDGAGGGDMQVGNKEQAL